MANAKKCDRCGKFYTGEEKNFMLDGIYISGVSFDSACSDYSFRHHDLCDECLQKLIEFLEEAKEV